ncbi:MAG TPA: CHASE domain-containing protein [Pyrinomonadaceae bacterium]|nr:CHASE domain-containing protein [Pyrinomonadaceae bacterium]
MAQSPNNADYRRVRHLVPYLVLIVGLIFTSIVSYRLARGTEAEDRARFQGLVQQVHVGIESRLETYRALVLAGAGLFSASESVDDKEFKSFVDTLKVAENYPGIRGIGFTVRVRPEERLSLIDMMKRQGKTEFRVWPESLRSEYHPVIYAEPPSERNRSLIGFDMSTESVRRAAMERARDTGLPAASHRVAPVTQVNSDRSPGGFLIFAPVYRRDRIASSVPERREALYGFVYSAFRADEFLQGVTPTYAKNDITFQIYSNDIKPENLLHRSLDAPSPEGHQPRFVATTTVDVGGQLWTINFMSLPGFDRSYIKSWVPYTFTAGILLSLLFGVIAQSQLRAREKAEQSEEEMREKESKVRQTLVERERAEEEIKEGEARYRQLVENANDIVFELDLTGKVTSMNKAAEGITGYTQEELLQMNMRDFLTPASDELARLMTQRKLAGEERTNYEVDVVQKNGQLITLEVSSRLARSEGKPIGIQGVARDITTRRHAEEALRQADQRALAEYERLLERVAGLAQTLGTARDLLAIFRGLREFTLLSVPCHGFFVSLYDPVRDVRTAVYGWADGSEIDVSELPPMPVTSSGPNSRAIRTNQVIITNDYMKQTLGHPAVLVGPDNGLRPQSSLSAPMAVMGRILGTIEVQTYEDSAYRDEHATAMRMAANLTAVAIENVTLLERESTARANAEESNRLKDEFLATVSHELRTPLTAILGWSRMLESGSLESETARRAVETIKRNAKSQAQIIDDILDVSRIITGNLYLELHPIELETVLEAAVNVVRPTAEAKGIHIELNLESEPIAVSGDPNRLQQVFWNLLSNAVKFTPSGGTVSVTLLRGDPQAEVIVSDTGPGISPEFLPYVFDRFRQADSTSTRHHGGLGLGLAIARHLIEIHGGTIEATSGGLGKGATFIVRLPVAGSRAIEVPREAEREVELHIEPTKLHDALAGLHVLMVDDDEDTLELLSAALRQRSADVTAVSSASAALEAIQNSRPDVLISDIAMPGEDGYQLIKKVIELKLEPELPAIAITAYAKEEDRQSALEAGFHRYLSKPVELREFISAVAEFKKRESERGTGNGEG